MTRINIIAVEDLINSHLMAEYHELPRVFTTLNQHLEKGKTLADVRIPVRYTLGAGHMKFFYNKLEFLRQRYYEIYHELLERGVNCDQEKYSMHQRIMCDVERKTKGDQLLWKPTPEEKYLNMARVARRSQDPWVLYEITGEED